MAYRVAVDIGGTFTDFCVFDETTNTLETHKVLSTPGNLALKSFLVWKSSPRERVSIRRKFLGLVTAQLALTLLSKDKAQPALL